MRDVFLIHVDILLLTAKEKINEKLFDRAFYKKFFIPGSEWLVLRKPIEAAFVCVKSTEMIFT